MCKGYNETGNIVMNIRIIIITAQLWSYCTLANLEFIGRKLLLTMEPPANLTTRQQIRRNAFKARKESLLPQAN